MITNNQSPAFANGAGASMQDVLTALQKGAQSADAERAAGYGKLAMLQTARIAQFQRHAALLASKLQSDDPRLAAIASQIAALQSQIPDLLAAQIQAATPAPAAIKLGYVIHGFARDLLRNPIPTASVALYDLDGNLFRAAKATSDKNGYFVVRVTTLNPPSTHGVAIGTVPSVASTNPIVLNLRVFTANGDQYPSSLPLIYPKPGQMDFIELLLGAAVPVPSAPPSSVPSASATKTPATTELASSNIQTMISNLKSPPGSSPS